MNRDDMIPFVILASCVLHNVCLDNKLEEYEDFIIEGHDDDDDDDDFVRQSINFQNDPEGIVKRQYLVTFVDVYSIGMEFTQPSKEQIVFLIYISTYSVITQPLKIIIVNEQKCHLISLCVNLRSSSIMSCNEISKMIEKIFLINNKNNATILINVSCL